VQAADCGRVFESSSLISFMTAASRAVQRGRRSGSCLTSIGVRKVIEDNDSNNYAVNGLDFTKKQLFLKFVYRQGSNSYK
jgi:hypothetical protein